MKSQMNDQREVLPPPGISRVQVSIYLDGLLKKERLFKEKEIQKWFGASEKLKKGNWLAWARFVRLILLDVTKSSLVSVLERPLTVEEKQLLEDRIKKFIEEYEESESGLREFNSIKEGETS